MGLTLEAEQRLRDVDLIDFYEQDAASWLATVRETRDFLAGKFPAGAPIRPDDVAKGLITILEVHLEFKDFRDQQKLRAKYWIKWFADLLVDRTWHIIIEENANGED